MNLRINDKFWHDNNEWIVISFDLRAECSHDTGLDAVKCPRRVKCRRLSDGCIQQFSNGEIQTALRQRKALIDLTKYNDAFAGFLDEKSYTLGDLKSLAQHRNVLHDWAWRAVQDAINKRTEPKRKTKVRKSETITAP